ncbi:MAG: hypothetical protein NVSMB17_04220 [Candidatus Dormibacteria bacterium]
MIPNCDDLRGDTLWHGFGDIFNPPGLTNHLGCVQAAADISGFGSLNFPPYSFALGTTATVYVDGVYFPATGARVGFTWRPDRVTREAEWQGLRLRTQLALPGGKMAAVERVEVTNLGGETRSVELRFVVSAGVSRNTTGWEFQPPTEADNAVQLNPAAGTVTLSARHSEAHIVQGCRPLPRSVQAGFITVDLEIPPGATGSVDFVAAIGATVDAATADFMALVGDTGEQLQRAQADWDAELAAAFTPGNALYSGHLPALQTEDPEIARLYYMGALGVIYHRRDNPHSVHGRSYDTLMPRYWQTVTFLWDYHLSSFVHALLDPAVMRGNIERWMAMDVHQHFGTEYLEGRPVGPWYAVNDYAMCVLARDYLRWSGDHAWLDTVPDGAGGQTVRARLVEYATTWKRFQMPSGLADYGGIGNLLECVSTYVNAVASLNAASVFTMRFAADICGDAAAATRLVDDAATLLREVHGLYVKGGGYWNARRPDDALVEVRHCYDLLTVLNTIPDDLTPTQRDEMAHFFVRELQTPTWMRALSAADADAPFNVRPDHQWTGAYPAWPPMTATGLYRVGRADIAFPWFKNLARSANQGPFGQAHFADDVVAPDSGGARKSSGELPYICDWACSSSGAYSSTVVEGIFGVDASLSEGISATPQFDEFDPAARLTGIAYQGRLYDADRHGVRALVD